MQASARWTRRLHRLSSCRCSSACTGRSARQWRQLLQLPSAPPPMPWQRRQLAELLAGGGHACAACAAAGGSTWAGCGCAARAACAACTAADGAAGGGVCCAACAAAGGTAGGGCGVAAAVALPLEPPAPRALPAPLAPLLAEQLEEAADALHALPASTCSALMCSGSPARSASPLRGLRARLRAPCEFVPIVFGLRAETEPEGGPPERHPHDARRAGGQHLPPRPWVCEPAQSAKCPSRLPPSSSSPPKLRVLSRMGTGVSMWRSTTASGARSSVMANALSTAAASSSPGPPALFRSWTLSSVKTSAAVIPPMRRAVGSYRPASRTDAARAEACVSEGRSGCAKAADALLLRAHRTAAAQRTRVI